MAIRRRISRVMSLPSVDVVVIVVVVVAIIVALREASAVPSFEPKLRLDKPQPLPRNVSDVVFPNAVRLHRPQTHVSETSSLAASVP